MKNRKMITFISTQLETQPQAFIIFFNIIYIIYIDNI
jgi:hypothetical protein